MIHMFEPSESLDTVWRELVWTEGRLLAEPTTAALSPPVLALLERIPALEARVRTAWRAEARAQAAVDVAAVGLELLVEGFADRMRRIASEDGDDTRYRKYFGPAASRVPRAGITTQLDTVQGWPLLLTQEPEADLKLGAERFAAAIARGRTAIAARAQAALDRETERLRSIVPFIEDVNAVRAGIYAHLDDRAAQTLGRAEAFFSISSGRPADSLARVS